MDNKLAEIPSSSLELIISTMEDVDAIVREMTTALEEVDFTNFSEAETQLNHINRSVKEIDSSRIKLDKEFRKYQDDLYANQLKEHYNQLSTMVTDKKTVVREYKDGLEFEKNETVVIPTLKGIIGDYKELTEHFDEVTLLDFLNKKSYSTLSFQYNKMVDEVINTLNRIKSDLLLLHNDEYDDYCKYNFSIESILIARKTESSSNEIEQMFVKYEVIIDKEFEEEFVKFMNKKKATYKKIN